MKRFKCATCSGGCELIVHSGERPADLCPVDPNYEGCQWREVPDSADDLTIAYMAGAAAQRGKEKPE
jgi:hypothetical protein